MFWRNRNDHDQVAKLPGSNRRALQPLILEQATEFVKDQLRQITLTAPFNKAQGRVGESFDNNARFWQYVINTDINGLGDIRLTDMVLTDWFPRSPGVYFTPEAEYARRDAMEDTMEHMGATVFTPYAKVSMIQGGFGSVRFKPLTIGSTRHFLGTATSDGYCHTGIPVAINDELIRQFGSDRLFGMPCDLVCDVRYLPKDIQYHFASLIHLPQIYLEVKDLSFVERRKSRSSWNVNITPMVFFESRKVPKRLDDANLRYRTDKFATFLTVESRSQQAMRDAVNWITDYVELYDGTVLSNFDETRPSFANAPFSLQNVMDANIDYALLEQLGLSNVQGIQVIIQELVQEKTIMTKNTINFGKGNVFHGNVNAVIAERIQNSFNSVENSETMSDELKELLGELGQHVAKLAEVLPPEEGEDVANDYKELVREAEKDQPERRRWEFSIEGLKKAAQNVSEIGKPIIEIATKIAVILSAAT